MADGTRTEAGERLRAAKLKAALLAAANMLAAGKTVRITPDGKVGTLMHGRKTTYRTLDVRDVLPDAPPPPAAPSRN